MKAFSLIVVLLAVFAIPAFPQNNPIEIPFTIQHGEVIVTVDASGRSVRLILDTGSQYTALDIEKTQALLRQISVRQMDGKSVQMEVGQTIISIGKRHFDLEVIAMKRLFNDVDGVLGENILSRFKRVTVDYENHVVRFE